MQAIFWTFPGPAPGPRSGHGLGPAPGPVPGHVPGAGPGAGPGPDPHRASGHTAFLKLCPDAYTGHWIATGPTFLNLYDAITP